MVSYMPQCYRRKDEFWNCNLAPRALRTNNHKWTHGLRGRPEFIYDVERRTVSTDQRELLTFLYRSTFSRCTSLCAFRRRKNNPHFQFHIKENNKILILHRWYVYYIIIIYISGSFIFMCTYLRSKSVLTINNTICDGQRLKLAVKRPQQQ